MSGNRVEQVGTRTGTRTKSLNSFRGTDGTRLLRHMVCAEGRMGLEDSNRLI